jgi:hypothetical protein
MQYYQCRNADKELVLGKYKFTFERTHYNEATSTYWGMLGVSDKNQTATLDAYGPSSGVYKISKEDAELLTEKKSRLGSHKSVITLDQRPNLTVENGKVVEVADKEDENDVDPNEKDAVELDSIMGEEVIETAESGQEEEVKPKRRGRPPKNKAK